VVVLAFSAHDGGLVLQKAFQALRGIDAIGLAALGGINLADAHALGARGCVHLQRVAIGDGVTATLRRPALVHDLGARGGGGVWQRRRPVLPS
jgi:hypothetical protein